MAIQSCHTIKRIEYIPSSTTSGVAPGVCCTHETTLTMVVQEKVLRCRQTKWMNI